MPKIRMLDGRMSPYRMNQVIDVSEDRAERWVRSGYAELVSALGSVLAPPAEEKTPKEEKKEKPPKK